MLQSEKNFINDLSDRLMKVKINERMDNGFSKLMTAGLIDEGDYMRVKKTMSSLQEDGEITPEMQKMTYNLAERFIAYIAKDNTVIDMLKEHKREVEKQEMLEEQRKIAEHNQFMKKQREAFERKYQIVEHNGVKHYVNEFEQLVEYDDDAILSFIENKKGAKNAKR